MRLRNEDAERVAGQIREHIQRLAGVIGSVKEELCAKGLRSLALPVQLRTVGNREINVQLHRDIVLGPCCPSQVIDLLESELAHPGGVDQDEPISLVGCPVRGRFVTGSVLQPEPAGGGRAPSGARPGCQGAAEPRSAPLDSMRTRG